MEKKKEIKITLKISNVDPFILMQPINNLNQALCFTLLQLKSAYAIAKLRKKGYSKNQFYKEAVNMYKEVCSVAFTNFFSF